MSAETLETTRLKLRPAIVQDARRIAMLANDADVARMTTRMPFPYLLEDAESFLTRCEAGEERVFAIEHEGALAGVIGFHGHSPLGPEVGYWLGRDYWGRGLATEAAEAALVWAGRDWGRRCVTSGHFADNPRSGAVLIKAGFLYTGEVEKRVSVARGGEAVDCRKMVWLA